MITVRTAFTLAAPLALALVATPMIAQQAPAVPGKADKALVKAGTYRIVLNPFNSATGTYRVPTR